MKEQVEELLRVLAGMPLWNSGRAGTLQWFDFGNQREVVTRKGEGYLVGTYALHVQCPWKITGPAGILVGSNDRYMRAGDDPFADLEDFDWDRPGVNRLDERIEEFMRSRGDDPLVVDSVSADELGGAVITLSRDWRIEILPMDSLDNEHWRLFQPYTEEPHYVVTIKGVEVD